MARDNRCALAIDAGGTAFKWALVVPGVLPAAAEVNIMPVDSSAAAGSEAILGAYGAIAGAALEQAAARGLRLAGIGVSTPGPFDYAGGRSLMRHKFAGIYGLDLRQAIRARCGGITQEVPISFMHDVHALLEGEQRYGAARGFSSVGAVTLGTGIGFGCLLDGRIADDGRGGPLISLYRLPYENGTLEDAVSRGGIVALYRQYSGQADSGGLEVKDLADRARLGVDAHAVRVFRTIGRIVGTALAEPLAKLGIECLIIGGRIAKSGRYLEDEIRLALRGATGLRQIRTAEHIDASPLAGAVKDWMA